MSYQLSLPFGPQPFNGKRTKRITITCSEDFDAFVEQMCKMTGESKAEMGYRYFLDGLRSDLGQVFMAEPHLDKKLSSILPKSKP